MGMASDGVGMASDGVGMARDGVGMASDGEGGSEALVPLTAEAFLLCDSEHAGSVTPLECCLEPVGALCIFLSFL